MDVVFNDRKLGRIETDADFKAGLADEVVLAYRKRLQLIRDAPDERDFYALRSLRFEKLKGDRRGQFSMRLNDQWRLILTFKGSGSQKKVVLHGIEDYH